MKTFFGGISNNFIRVNLGAIAVGLLIFFFPALYGDSYHGLRMMLESPPEGSSATLILILTLAILKPLAAALTLGAGGDGGVFAPSIVAGAFLGLSFAIIGNTYFGMQFIPVNFALIGAASMLSAALFAPLTSSVLICSLLPGGFMLYFPVFICCFIATATAKKILPYNVYTYDRYVNATA
jgi:CIC family chloride channel protein